MTIKHILYVQPIFAPDVKRCDRNTNSIKSMGEYIKTHGTDGIQVTIVFGGYCKTEELWQKIKDEIMNAFGPTITPIVFDKNYGKSMVVNKLVEMARQQNVIYQAILTADSDIMFPLENKHMFGRLAYAAIHLENIKKKPFGLLGLNQLQQNCHYQSCQENSIEYTLDINENQIKEKVVWPNHPGGIAGGCLFVSNKLWSSTNGYKTFGVYGSDDAILLLECGQKGFSWQMFDSLGIIHPHEEDPTYAKWKVETCQRENRTGPKTNIDQQIKEAEDFWNNHGNE